MILRRTVLIVLALLVFVAVAIGFQTFRARSKQVPLGEVHETLTTDSLAVERLSSAVRFKTITPSEGAARENLLTFLDFQDYLIDTFPLVFEHLQWDRLSHGGQLVFPPTALLMKWYGSNRELSPILLLAHQDVVPVEASSENQWHEPPFSGRISGGYIWGRGSMDDKASLITILQAVESLLASGFRPERTIYIGFGDDEEIAGGGATAMARELSKELGIRPPMMPGRRLAFVVDEGMAVTQGYLPGFKGPVALIGIAEKGSALVELSVTAEGGHVSMPPRPSASGLIAEAVAALEAHPMPASLDGPTRDMLEFLAPEAPFSLKAVFANLWLFGPVVKANLAKKSATDATTRTTTAIVGLESGLTENVVPSEAKAVVSFRIHPRDTVADVLEHVQSVVDTSHIRVKLLPGSREPSPVSDPNSPAFSVVAGAIRQVFPDAVVAPALVLGGTDSRHFSHISDAVYRFVPLRFLPGDDARVHGINERVSVENVTEMVRFYRALILAASRPF